MSLEPLKRLATAATVGAAMVFSSPASPTHAVDLSRPSIPTSSKNALKPLCGPLDMIIAAAEQKVGARYPNPCPSSDRKPDHQDTRGNTTYWIYGNAGTVDIDTLDASRSQVRRFVERFDPVIGTITLHGTVYRNLTISVTSVDRPTVVIIDNGGGLTADNALICGQPNVTACTFYHSDHGGIGLPDQFVTTVAAPAEHIKDGLDHSDFALATETCQATLIANVTAPAGKNIDQVTLGNLTLAAQETMCHALVEPAARNKPFSWPDYIFESAPRGKRGFTTPTSTMKQLSARMFDIAPIADFIRPKRKGGRQNQY